MKAAKEGLEILIIARCYILTHLLSGCKRHNGLLYDEIGHKNRLHIFCGVSCKLGHLTRKLIVNLSHTKNL